MSGSKRSVLTVEVAEKLLPNRDRVHIFWKNGNSFVDSYWSKVRVIDRMKTIGCELSGAEATKARHGLASFKDDDDFMFIETRGENAVAS